MTCLEQAKKGYSLAMSSIKEAENVLAKNPDRAEEPDERSLSQIFDSLLQYALLQYVMADGQITEKEMAILEKVPSGVGKDLVKKLTNATDEAIQEYVEDQMTKNLFICNAALFGMQLADAQVDSDEDFKTNILAGYDAILSALIHVDGNVDKKKTALLLTGDFMREHVFAKIDQFTRMFRKRNGSSDDETNA